MQVYVEVNKNFDKRGHGTVENKISNKDFGTQVLYLNVIQLQTLWLQCAKYGKYYIFKTGPSKMSFKSEDILLHPWI